MKILIIGSGGREYAIASKIKEEDNSVEIIFAPGNGKTESEFKNIDIGVMDFDKLITFAKDNDIDYTIVGPEDPLCFGIVDKFEAEGLKIFGPKKEAAMFEKSKAFSKRFMEKYHIATAKYLETDSIDEAKKYAYELISESKVNKVVLKYDGLAQGKGVIIASSVDDIDEALNELLLDKKFGDDKIIVEEYIDGFETSVHVLISNGEYIMLPSAKDHKKVYEGETGENTGGMGSYSPNLMALPYLKDIEEELVKPFIKGLKAEGIDYRGVLFAGLMINSDGIKVLEFNTRFGDPETEVILERIDSSLLDALIKTSEAKLNEYKLKVNDKKIVNVVLASGGYPAKYDKGYEIKGLDKLSEDVKVNYAGVKASSKKLLTNGGRVLNILSKADTFEEAYKKVYDEIQKISFDKMHYRRDIGPVVKRVYVCKKDEFDAESNGLTREIKDFLKINIDSIKVYNRYDIELLSDEEINKISNTILCEKPVDNIYLLDDALEMEKNLKNAFVVRYKKGQFDQREQGLKDTIKVTLGKDDVLARCEKVYDIKGDVSEEDIKKIKKYLINTVDQAEGVLIGIPTTLKESFDMNIESIVYDGFIKLDDEGLKDFHEKNSLAMSIEDLKVFQDYFIKENRDPSQTELKLIDTYWSDHCRHTTFNTQLTNINFEGENDFIEVIRNTLNEYLKARNQFSKKDLTLMDLATIVTKKLRGLGKLNDLEVSEEINACSVKIKVSIDGRLRDYLLMFKNETHNHPTEIEPFGGAQTCLGGAIRDPLSGRSYVYQAMRITGAADPREAIEDTLEGKLPQRKIVLDAARGYSSYGNQIGLATGYVDEVYHPGYKAKRMEVGAVIAAAPMENVFRGVPAKGDIIILLGGKTGRDGIGGATGSSKIQTDKSVEDSAAEVQKGNAPTERKIQRLFRIPELAKMIKRCNDFGAGGVSVAIGELADSLLIHLEKVPLKYQGLSPMEIAISESQERMAVVIAKENYEKFKEYANAENLEATIVAEVTDSERLIMMYNDIEVCNLKREFLNSTGAPRKQDVIFKPEEAELFNEDLADDFTVELKKRLEDINVASKKSLIERFDSSVGRGSIVQPLGGKNQLSPEQAMIARIPTTKGESSTASIMTYGFDPYLSEKSSFFGAYYAVVESLAKIASHGASPFKARLTFQEYFEKLNDDPYKWSKPFEALLGAFKICNDLQIPSIGGKDSMSGTFNDLNVPPTLISFAVTTMNIEDVVTPELKGNMKLGLIRTTINDDNTLDLNEFKKNSVELVSLISRKKVRSAVAINRDTTLPLLMKMAFGNDIGFNINMDADIMFKELYGSYIVEYTEDLPCIEYLGTTNTDASIIINGRRIDLEEYKEAYEKPLLDIFGQENRVAKTENKFTEKEFVHKSKKPVDEVKVIIPVFPGTNSEYDSKYAFEKEGAKVDVFVFNNLDNDHIDKSIDDLANKIKESQILFIPGGFSLSDEPDGSGKFIANVLRNTKVKEAVEYLLEENDGLILGICNGFQALVKTGLLPFGKIKDIDEDDPTLTYNNIARHVARIVKTKALTTSSPWLKYINKDKVYRVPISHGEGRLLINKELYEKLSDNAQLAFEYIDNPNGSNFDIESMLSPDGKILGKMAHSERVETDTFKNVSDIEIQNIFKAGVEFFKKD